MTERPDYQISPHFSFYELTRTSKVGLQAGNRIVKPSVLNAAYALCWGLLEPIRQRFAPVIIHSGYRGPELNKAIGGSDNSQHKRFEAADFHVKNYSCADVWQWIWKISNLHFGQLILETPREGAEWVHISLGFPFRDRTRSGEVLTYDGERYEKVDRVVLD